MAHRLEEVHFTRETEVILIPDGLPQRLPDGTRAWITQVLGHHYTLQLETGRLVRLSAFEADAIGKPPLMAPEALDSDEPLSEERVWDVLRTCYDPEIPLDIVQLGLIYGVELMKPDADDAPAHVHVMMTLTAPGCGMGQVLADDVASSVRGLPGVGTVDVQLTFDPPWTPDRMSEEARLELGFFY